MLPWPDSDQWATVSLQRTFRNLRPICPHLYSSNKAIQKAIAKRFSGSNTNSIRLTMFTVVGPVFRACCSNICKHQSKQSSWWNCSSAIDLNYLRLITSARLSSHFSVLISSRLATSIIRHFRRNQYGKRHGLPRNQHLPSDQHLPANKFQSWPTLISCLTQTTDERTQSTETIYSHEANTCFANAFCQVKK